MLQSIVVTCMWSGVVQLQTDEVFKRVDIFPMWEIWTGASLASIAAQQLQYVSRRELSRSGQWEQIVPELPPYTYCRCGSEVIWSIGHTQKAGVICTSWYERHLGAAAGWDKASRDVERWASDHNNASCNDRSSREIWEDTQLLCKQLLGAFGMYCVALSLKGSWAIGPNLIGLCLFPSIVMVLLAMLAAQNTDPSLP